MRFTVLAALIGVALPVPVLAQAAVPAPVAKAAAAAVREPYPQPTRTRPCCVRTVWDARGQAIGDVIDFDERFPSQPLGAYVAYRLKGRDAVPIGVTTERFYTFENQGGSTLLFTTPDCSGTSMFAMLYYPPLGKRYATVLNTGYPGGPQPLRAWLWVTDPLPVRGFPPAGTVYHSQFDGNNCQPYPAPGYTISTASGIGGFPMHRVEDLLAKYTRPFYINY